MRASFPRSAIAASSSSRLRPCARPSSLRYRLRNSSRRLGSRPKKCPSCYLDRDPSAIRPRAPPLSSTRAATACPPAREFRRFGPPRFVGALDFDHQEYLLNGSALVSNDPAPQAFGSPSGSLVFALDIDRGELVFRAGGRSIADFTGDSVCGRSRVVKTEEHHPG